MDFLNFSASTLIAGLLFGIIGTWTFRQGKRRHNLRVTLLGIFQIFFPYFTEGPWLTWGIGLGLCIATYLFWNSN